MAATRAEAPLSQPTPPDPVPSPDPDPLLEFFAEPEAEPPALAAAPTNESPEPVAKAEDPAPPAVVPADPEPDPELLRRLDRTDRMLEKAQIELSTLKSDVATLVSAIDDIKKRQSRPADKPPLQPVSAPPPPARVSRLAAAAVTAVGMILVVVVWAMWSLASYDMPEFAAAEVQAAPEPAISTPVLAAAADTAPIEIQKTAAVSEVEQIPEPTPRPPRANDVDRDEPEPREPRREVVEYVGTLSIDASPAGDVFIDRKRVGRTPVRMEGLRAGSHLVWIEREGFQRWTRVVLVAANRVSRVSAELAPLQ